MREHLTTFLDEQHAQDRDGAVRWLGTPQGPGLGVNFAGLCARDLWAINKYFERT